MILSEFVETSLHPKTIKYYHSLGYVGDLYDKIYVKPLDLPKVSRVKILVKCDCCDNVNNIHYANYNFLFIIDKDYIELENIIEHYESKQNC